jgi:hypothetical protein
MSDLQAVFEGKQPAQSVPLWDLHFHAWDNASGRHLIIGREYAERSPTEQEQALAANVEIMLSVAKEFNFSAVTIPDPYWEIAPGIPTYYWLPDTARLDLLRALRKNAPPTSC